ncbi:MAG TPA: HAD-IIA family hydrolase [Verrucomicrobiota bacterium]|nr:HAD-IIA family hydrolase [Verrucomicrobiota bacterium]HNT13895.1 HAD-IIA family hydrolase [Verrucomicrobiota bacterium]
MRTAAAALSTPKLPAPDLPARLRQLRHVALDMDGTIYRGNTLFAATRPFLQLLDQLGIGHTFLTNNPSKNVADYLEHFKTLGIPATPQQLYTSAQATIGFLQQRFPEIRRLFVLGTASMAAAFAQAGFELMPESPGAEPDAVVVGFDLALTYPRLCRAAWWIQQGKPYFATNPDRVCPTDQPTVLVDCGAICAALESATGRPPTAVLGKPDPAMLQGILRQHRLRASELAMVGDRLYTDMAMAHRTGALSVLVLTGETTHAQAQGDAAPPDLVVPSLAEFGAQLRAAHALS